MVHSSNQGHPNLQHISLYPLVLDDDQHHLTTSSAELLDALNRYFDILATTVYGQPGDVDKFLGDGMLALLNILHKFIKGPQLLGSEQFMEK